MRHTRTLLALLMVILGAVGCGPKGPNKDPVYAPNAAEGAVLEGTVYAKKGVPLTGGTLTIVSATDPTKKVTAMFGRDGKYRTAGVPVGDVLFSVDTEAIRGQDFSQLPGTEKLTAAQKEGMPQVPPEALAKMPKYVSIDKKFADPKTSGLKFKVAAGTNTHDIELK
ncbi:MAG: hypothetical protein ACRCZF_21170 [Gemmataceae bacterium]